MPCRTTHYKINLNYFARTGPNKDDNKELKFTK